MNVTVIKIGGSLTVYPQKLRELCTKLGEFAEQHKLVVVSGGAQFADTVRQMDRQFKLSKQAAHRMAILGMDQYGLLLADLMPNSVVINRLECLEDKLFVGKLPIFLPATLMLNEDPIENSWDVTSDSIAVYLASRLQAKKVVLVKDVDGIYTTDPKQFPNAQLIERLSATELVQLGDQSCVDTALPKLLSSSGLDCFVVNGLFPERIKAVLDGQKTIGTLITP